EGALPPSGPADSTQQQWGQRRAQVAAHISEAEHRSGVLPGNILRIRPQRRKRKVEAERSDRKRRDGDPKRRGETQQKTLRAAEQHENRGRQTSPPPRTETLVDGIRQQTPKNHSRASGQKDPRLDGAA